MHDYAKLAPFLELLKKDENAKFFYDLFADALVWSDEVPPPDFPNRVSFNTAELRGLWRYRTTLILGQPDEKRRPAWEKAIECFPNWPGFDPKRRDIALASTFSALQGAAMKKWEEDDERINASLAKKKQQAIA
jgi:hypothetical protein